ncbi:xanthotoxin 5-hydroxylase CYP82C4-like [Rutidosis leptorrhynchoides]|uniref:xanthotoxin 5-hydroxylase CYP82C4-like n=1 Tax=Rutidosis leptorrhynchoides TaxID=125765 RepID=UPI003A994776
MESFPLFLSFLILFLCVLICRFKRTKINNTKTSIKLVAPEPSGALPIVGHLHQLHGRVPLARILGQKADDYGPIYSLRLGSHRALVVSSWQMVKECFTTNDRNFASRPNMAVSRYMGYNSAVFALAPYGPYWREIRKMVTLELLKSQRLEKLKHVRNSEVKYLINDLSSLCLNNKDRSCVVNMTKWFEHVTFNIIVRMLASKRFVSDCNDNKGSKDDLEVKEAINKGLYLSGIVVVSDVIPNLEWMDIGGHLKAMKKAGKELDVVLGKWVDEHVEKGHEYDEGDFIDVMLSILPKDAEMFGYGRETIIKATTLILILTGSESTAETLTWALSLLLNNPDILKTAQNELDNCVGKDKWVEESDIQKLTYLQAIVKETLRMYPPGPLAGPREAIEDCNIGGYHVSKGTRLIVNVWKLHRDPKVWSDPDEFRPERFLDEHSHVNYQGQNFEYIPFSSGRRMCPASTFALQVIHLILAQLIQGFDWSTPNGELVDMSEGLGIALPKVKPLEVMITPRLSSELY